MSIVESILRRLPTSLGKNPETSDYIAPEDVVIEDWGGMPVGKKPEEGGIVISNEVVQSSKYRGYPDIDVKICKSYPECHICKLRDSCEVGKKHLTKTP